MLQQLGGLPMRVRVLLFLAFCLIPTRLAAQELPVLKVVIPAQLGRVDDMSTPSGFHCAATCAKTVQPPGLVPLTATPNAGVVFTGWSGGGCSGSAGCTPRLGGPGSTTTVTAFFAEPVMKVQWAGQLPALRVTFTDVTPGRTRVVLGTCTPPTSCLLPLVAPGRRGVAKKIEVSTRNQAQPDEMSLAIEGPFLAEGLGNQAHALKQQLETRPIPANRFARIDMGAVKIRRFGFVPDLLVERVTGPSCTVGGGREAVLVHRGGSLGQVIYPYWSSDTTVGFKLAGGSATIGVRRAHLVSSTCPAPATTPQPFGPNAEPHTVCTVSAPPPLTVRVCTDR